MKHAINQKPIAVAVQADSKTFINYRSGVITTADCGNNPNHSVAVVGYGIDYYIVKNSWGTTWGDQGYVKIGTGDGYGICGINRFPAYPTN